MALVRKYRRRRVIRRPRVFRKRLDFNKYDDIDIFQRFRFHTETIKYIQTAVLMDEGHPTTRRSQPLDQELQLLAALRFYATGSHFRLIGDSLGISIASVSRSVDRITKALCAVANTFIKFPVGDDAAVAKQRFYKIAGFPNVISAIDGTFVRITAPKENEVDFVNRKGYHSLNIQMACDSTYMITNCVAKWPGSVHDSRIFRESGLCRGFESGDYDGFLIGDSGYACRQYLMTPFNSPADDSQINYNKSICRTRVIIEQLFGILKKRFACLHNEMRLTPAKSAQVVMACAVLHNIGIFCGDIIQADEQEMTDDDNIVVPAAGDGANMRAHICSTYFS